MTGRDLPHEARQLLARMTVLSTARSTSTNRNKRPTHPVFRVWPITILDHGERANQGNPEVTGWCPVCRERAVPMRNGTCGFCDTPLDDEKGRG